MAQLAEQEVHETRSMIYGKAHHPDNINPVNITTCTDDGGARRPPAGSTHLRGRPYVNQVDNFALDTKVRDQAHKRWAHSEAALISHSNTNDVFTSDRQRGPGQRNSASVHFYLWRQAAGLSTDRKEKAAISARTGTG
ncbi:hypothetical protein NQZ68_009075 [Dissostichus eleginoides]|nr:hypothetical protein NQZ68_009075 [Dissostichus eleginoides]